MSKPRAGAVLVFRHGPNGPEMAVGRRLGEPCKDMWGYPGGGVKRGESGRDGAARELLEEAGVRIDPSKLTYIITQQNTHWVYIFATIVDDTTELKSGSDMADMQWMPVNQLPKLAFNGNHYVEKGVRKLKLGEGAMIPAGKITIESIAREITEDPDLLVEYALPPTYGNQEPEIPWDQANGLYESAGDYRIQVQLVDSDRSKGRFKISGTVRQVPVSGVMTIYAAGGEYNGWDWEGVPDLEEKEIVQVILDFFEPLFG